MTKPIKTLAELLQYVGGSMNMGILLGCEQMAVLQWRHRGIPHKYWQKILDKTPIEHEDLFNIDQKIRNQK